MNIKLLCKAIETAGYQVQFIDETLIVIKGKRVLINSDLVHIREFTFRYSYARDFLFRLREVGLLDVSDDTILKINDNYRSMLRKADPFIIQQRAKHAKN